MPRESTNLDVKGPLVLEVLKVPGAREEAAMHGPTRLINWLMCTFFAAQAASCSPAENAARRGAGECSPTTLKHSEHLWMPAQLGLFCK